MAYTSNLKSNLTETISPMFEKEVSVNLRYLRINCHQGSWIVDASSNILQFIFETTIWFVHRCVSQPQTPLFLSICHIPLQILLSLPPNIPAVINWKFSVVLLCRWIIGIKMIEELSEKITIKNSGRFTCTYTQTLYQMKLYEFYLFQIFRCHELAIHPALQIVLR